MKNLVSEILTIAAKAGNRLKPGLILIIVLGTIFESLSISLIVPVVILLARGINGNTKVAFNMFTKLTGSHSNSLFILSTLCLLIVIYLLKTLFIAFVNAKQNSFVFELEAKVSTQLLKIYLNKPYSFHLQKNSADLTKNIFYETKQLCNAIGQALILFSDSLVLLLIAIILFYFQPVITLVAILFIGIIVFVFITFIRKKIKIWAADRLRNDAERVKVLADVLGNIKDVKLYGREKKFHEDYTRKSTLSIYASMMYTSFQRLPTLWLEFLAVFTLIGLFGAISFSGETFWQTIPLLTLFAASMFRALPPLTHISSAFQTIRFFTPLIHHVYAELKDDGIDFPYSKNPTADHAFEHDIKLKDISFVYENSKKLLFSNLSLTIVKGSYIGLIGQSGSGKSTLIDIIIGLLQPVNGTVTVDGININKDLRKWQDKIGYVQQTINLTDDTIANNIAFGIAGDHVNTVLLSQAIIDAHLQEFVNTLPLGVHTLVGEKGVRLSGGQRQRIAIARALYHNPSVLVFDEATSSLDNKTEAEIMRAISLLKAKKTIIFVTHKKNLLKDCDKVYEMKMGELIDKSQTLTVI